MLRIAIAAGLIGLSLASDAEAKTVEEYLAEMGDGLPYGFSAELAEDIPKARELLKACVKREPRRRREACMSIARAIAKPELAEQIRLFLKDEDYIVRQVALHALSNSLGEAAVPDLKRAAVEDPEPGNRVFAMGIVDNPFHLKPLEARREHLDFLKERLGDRSPLVKLTAALMLARAGHKIPRELAIENLNAPMERNSRPSYTAYELLGFVGDENDLKRLSKLVDADKALTRRQRLILVKEGRGEELDEAYKAGKAVPQLRMTLAKDAAAREALLRQSLRDNPSWAGAEAYRRYFLLGEKGVMALLESVAADATHGGAARAAKRTIEFIREKEAGGR